MKELLSRIAPQLTDYKYNREQYAIQLEKEKEKLRLEWEAEKQKRLEFRSRFENLLLKDIKNLVAASKTLFFEYGLEIRQESHKKGRNRHAFESVNANLSYTILEITSKELLIRERGKNSSCLIFVGDEHSNTVQLFLKKVKTPDYTKEYIDLGKLLFTLHLDQYDFETVLPHFEMFVELRLLELQEDSK